MRSSAMRDMMAITARPEIISLAGGRPDTSTFPVDAFVAEMDRIASGKVPEVLQYGPTEGLQLVREQITEVDPTEVLDLLGSPDVAILDIRAVSYTHLTLPTIYSV